MRPERRARRSPSARSIGTPGRTLQLRAGSTHTFRVTMVSAALGTRYARVRLAIPAKAAGRYGYLSFDGGDDYYSELPAGATVDQMLRAFSNAPRNDQVLTGLTLSGSHRSIRLRSRTLVPATVAGGVSVDVEVVG